MTAGNEAAVARLLTDLGDKPDTIADRLRSKGITGQRNEACHCPIASFLLSTGAYQVVAIAERSYVRPKRGDAFVFSPPKPTLKFVELFDRGRYPFLEAA